MTVIFLNFKIYRVESYSKTWIELTTSVYFYDLESF